MPNLPDMRLDDISPSSEHRIVVGIRTNSFLNEKEDNLKKYLQTLALTDKNTRSAAESNSSINIYQKSTIADRLSLFKRDIISSTSKLKHEKKSGGGCNNYGEKLTIFKIVHVGSDIIGNFIFTV